MQNMKSSRACRSTVIVRSNEMSSLPIVMLEGFGNQIEEEFIWDKSSVAYFQKETFPSDSVPTKTQEIMW